MRILLVEDQDAIRRLIEALVKARGHEVVAVNSGAKAIEASMKTPPDLVLLDLHLPGQYDGFEVCRRIRGTSETSKVPVVVISARDDEEARRKAAEAGATSYYGKPFSPTALLDEIMKFQTERKRDV